MLEEMQMEEKSIHKPTGLKKVLIITVYIVSIVFFLCAFYQVFLSVGILRY